MELHFEELWVTDNNRCLVGIAENAYYVLDEAEMIYNETNQASRVYPSYSAKLKNLYFGTPLKWGRSVIQEDWQDNGALDFALKPIADASAILKSARSKDRLADKSPPAQSSVNLIDLVPASEKQKRTRFWIWEVIGSTRHDRLFVHELNGSFLVFTKGGQYAGIIESIPKDKVFSISGWGKRFNIGADGRLYYVRTSGFENTNKREDNSKSCRTQVLRW